MNDLILIKPNQCCISLGDSHKERISAENHSSLFHYCKLSDLEKILKSGAIKLNNLVNIDKNSDYERDNVDPDFWGLIFIACLTASTARRSRFIQTRVGIGGLRWRRCYGYLRENKTRTV